MDYTYNEYINDISKGHIPACKKVKQAVLRHINDLKAAEKGTFPYHFDDSYAQRAVDFFGELVHTKGEFAGKKLHPEPWQQFIIAMLYGWRRNDNGLRRFRRAYIQIARKNGKTFFSSGVGLYDLMSEPGSEVYSAATKHDQAMRCFADAKNSVKYSKTFRKYITSLAHALTFRDGKMTALSSDSKTLDGLNPSCAIIDEYHAHKTDELLNVIESGMSSRRQPMLFIITTAGHDRNVPCYEEYERVSKILAGVKGYENETYFCIVYELDPKDDWKNEKNWYKANPNLGVSVKTDDLRIKAKNALQKSTDEVEFRTKNLDVWMNAAEVWITDTKWQKCMKRFDEKRLEGLRCWGGIDLSKRLDFTAFTWYFALEDGRRYAKHYFFIPEQQIDVKMKTDSYLIRQWIQEGYIYATPGDTVDYDFMFEKILADGKKYDVQEIAYDRNLAEHLIQQLSDVYTCVEFNQSITGMSEPSKDWEKLVVDGKLTDSNPVMRWMVSCASVKPDANGNIKPLKPDANKSSKRIDGVITSIMADNRLEIALQAENEQNRFSIGDLIS